MHSMEREENPITCLKSALWNNKGEERHNSLKKKGLRERSLPPDFLGEVSHLGGSSKRFKSAKKIRPWGGSATPRPGGGTLKDLDVGKGKNRGDEEGPNFGGRKNIDRKEKRERPLSAI